MKPGQDRVNSKPAAEWAPDFVPALGEICINLENGQYKYGDGATRHADLPLSTSGFAMQADVLAALSQFATKGDLATKVDAATVQVIATQIVNDAIAKLPPPTATTVALPPV